MPSIKERNDKIRRLIKEPASCHCTYRTLLDETSCDAFSNAQETYGELRARQWWNHTDNNTFIHWELPIGTSFQIRIPVDCEDSEAAAAIFEGYERMARAWGEE